MSPQTLTFIILATLIAAPPPASAKEKKKPVKPVVRTWKTVVDYVLKNGGEDSIKAPASRTLGYESDEITALSLGLDAEKSKDGREHTIFVVYEKTGTDAATPKEIVLGSIHITSVDSKKHVDSYRIRLKLDGTLIGGMHATGAVGHVVQEAMSSDSKVLLSVFKNESNLSLKEIDLAQLTP